MPDEGNYVWWGLEGTGRVFRMEERKFPGTISARTSSDGPNLANGPAQEPLVVLKRWFTLSPIAAAGVRAVESGAEEGPILAEILETLFVQLQASMEREKMNYKFPI